MLTDVTTPTYSPTRDALNATPRAEIRMGEAAADGEKEFSLVGDGEFSFWDFLDVINPLQHIPLVNSAYREITGDTIKPVMKLAGGALFGGPLGLGIAALDVGVEGTTGKDTGQHVAALFDGVDDPRGTAYRLYTDSMSPDNPLDDRSADLARAKEMIAALDRRKAPAEVAEADANAMIALPALTVVPTDTPEPAELPPWDSPMAAAAPPAESKAFAMPERRHTGAPKMPPGVRAAAPAAAEAPAELSADAMAAAGLTPEAVQEVLRAHGQAKAEDAALAAQPAHRPAAKPVARPGSATADQGEPLWFFDRMNTALDKYRTAQGLSPAAAAQ